MDHLEKGTLDLSQLRFLVLDEADEMLKMGFAEDVETILADTPDDKHVALFSATMPAQIRRISKKYLHDPVEITVETKTTTAPNITQRYLTVSYPQKVDALTRILEVENFEGMIVFVRTKNETETLAEKLRARGFSAMAINGDVAQNQRERTVDQLKSGKLDILVATDVAARGLDVERISHVVNYDIPTDTESYVHRIGRTGRAGRSGDAISFVTPRERHLLKAIEKATRQSLVPMNLPTVDDINATRLTRFDDAISAALSTDKVDFFRDVIAHYVNEHNVPEADVAAALAVVLQGDEPMLLEPEPERPARRAYDRDDRGRDDRRDDRPGGRHGDRRDRPERGGRDARGGRGGSSGPLATYRIAVGKRPARRAKADRRCARQRGRPRTTGLRAHRHPLGPLPGRAARHPAARHVGQAPFHPHLRPAHRARARRGAPRRERAGAPQATALLTSRRRTAYARGRDGIRDLRVTDATAPSTACREMPRRA